MSANAKISAAIARPKKKSLAQKVPKGVASLLGEAEEPVTEIRREEKKKDEQQPTGEGGAQKKDERVTSSLRYRKRYMEKLDLLYLHEKIKRRTVTKADLVEEALDLLFKKYDA